MLLLLIGIVFCAASVALVARAVALPRLRTEAGLAQIGGYGFHDSDAAHRATAPLTDALDRLAERVGAGTGPRKKPSDTDQGRSRRVKPGPDVPNPATFNG